MVDYEVALKLLLAVPLGGMIGFEREIQNQPAGLRTHIVLCVGSTLIMLCSIHVAEISPTRFADVSRIAAQVVTGIGFLGAGAIMRLGTSIRGLTTAASLWTTAGIGLAIGSGFYFGAILTTLIILIVLNPLKKWPKIFFEARSAKTINIVANESYEIIGSIEAALSNLEIEINSIQITRNILDKSLDIQIEVNQKNGIDILEITKRLTSTSGIVEVEIR